MASPLTEEFAIRVTPGERTLILGLAEMRKMDPSDLLRELIGLGREDELRSAARRLRLVSA